MALQDLSGAYKKDGERAWSDQTRWNDLKLKASRCIEDICTIFLPNFLLLLKAVFWAR